jgi:hypothetical protein
MPKTIAMMLLTANFARFQYTPNQTSRFSFSKFLATIYVIGANGEKQDTQ